MTSPAWGLRRCLGSDRSRTPAENRKLVVTIIVGVPGGENILYRTLVALTKHVVGLVMYPAYDRLSKRREATSECLINDHELTRNLTARPPYLAALSNKSYASRISPSAACAVFVVPPWVTTEPSITYRRRCHRSRSSITRIDNSLSKRTHVSRAPRTAQSAQG